MSYLSDLIQAASSEGTHAFAAGAKRGEQERLLKLKDLLGKQKDQEDLDAIKNMKASGGVPEGASIGIGRVHVGSDRTPQVDMQQERFEQKQANDYSKRLEKHNGFLSTLQELESRTNQDGKGGVLTNPDAQLISAGKAMSAVPTALVGIGELTGAVPKGAADERKLLERVQLEYQKSMSGMRTSSEMANREKQAMGWMASGDPSLVAKGIRSLSKNVGQAVRTIQGGYKPSVRDQVHSMSGDPLDTLGHVYEDEPIGAKKQVNPALPASPRQNDSAAPMSFEEFKKRKAAGQL
jgi:hypothetical protein